VKTIDRIAVLEEQFVGQDILLKDLKIEIGELKDTVERMLTPAQRATWGK